MPEKITLAILPKSNTGVKNNKNTAGESKKVNNAIIKITLIEIAICIRNCFIIC
ncbi:hypothetical protein RC62_3008 [Flavobacterium aquidurense]|uniref:Uncharacterized protein n=1 Tax=Flavobacterium aquidurense TaxID=362413 RepID=A0A0Q0RNN7_9FLAO|nr:hypothetical protein RC62_3008 [Flavobacterium aquidurense]